METKYVRFYGLCIAILAIMLSACQSNQRKEAKKEEVHPHPEFELYDGGFTILNLSESDSVLLNFKNKYTAEQQHIILALNRRDFNNLRQADSLIIPDSIWTDFMSYTPFPKQVKALDSVDKIILFSYPVQAFGVYEKGWLMHWGPTSMGSEAHPTETGLSYANWKKEEHISTVDDEWLLRWNVNIRNQKGIGWHQYSMPGYPASHSCLRLLENDARWLYEWVDQWVLEDHDTVLAKGTPVIVFGSYEFDGTAPWWRLANDPGANRISEKDVTEVVKPHLSDILKEQSNRNQVAGQSGTADSTGTRRES